MFSVDNYCYGMIEMIYEKDLIFIMYIRGVGRGARGLKPHPKNGKISKWNREARKCLKIYYIENFQDPPPQENFLATPLYIYN